MNKFTDTPIYINRQWNNIYESICILNHSYVCEQKQVKKSKLIFYDLNLIETITPFNVKKKKKKKKRLRIMVLHFMPKLIRWSVTFNRKRKVPHVTLSFNLKYKYDPKFFKHFFKYISIFKVRHSLFVEINLNKLYINL